MPTSTDNNIRFAGDVKIDKIEIVTSSGFGQDITNQVSAIQIFEDLFSPFISGNLIIDDALDLINLFPFVGEEFLNLRIKTPSFDLIKDGTRRSFNDKFYIYKATERELIGDKRVVFKLHFISIEAVVDLNKRISSAFEGKCSDIVRDIIQKPIGLETKKNYIFEDTPNGTKFVSNFWNPIKCINYVAQQALNKKNSPTYTFFENRQGLNFVSLESLAGATAIQDFVYDKYTRDIRKNGQSSKNVEAEYKRIEEISIPNVYDYMERTRSGMFASKLITHDLVTKKYSALNFDMLKGYEKQQHLNAHPLASTLNIARANAAIFVDSKYYGNFNGYTDVTNTKTIQKRVSLMRQFEANKIEIVVPGRTDYTVGKKVYVKLFKTTPLSQTENVQDNIDNMFSGYYLIGAINHYITRERHECNMELIKDSLILDLDKGRK
jgi:hypothetical protein